MATDDHEQQARSADNIDQVVAAAFARHEAGELDRAEALYRKALAASPISEESSRTRSS
jgi:hypothetical protein